jgi:histidinol-phosphatase (PHP family)
VRFETQIHDEHMHLRPHGIEPPPAHRLAPIVAACAERGVVPGIREHAPLPAAYRLGPHEDYLFCMRPSEVDAFLAEFDGTGVAVGFEIDHLDGHEEETRAIVADLVARAARKGLAIGGLTGSVHFLPGNAADLDPAIDKGDIGHFLCDYLPRIMEAHVREHGAAATVTDYFGCVRRMIATGFYDVVGHLELVRKWDAKGEGGRPKLFGEVEELYANELEATLKLAAEADVIVEYNTSGTDITIGRPYLSDDAVRACVRHGVKIALSSDTHLPKHVGRHFDAAIATLRGLGVDTLWAVRDRERVAVRL